MVAGPTTSSYPNNYLSPADPLGLGVNWLAPGAWALNPGKPAIVGPVASPQRIWNVKSPLSFQSRPLSKPEFVAGTGRDLFLNNRQGLQFPHQEAAPLVNRLFEDKQAVERSIERALKAKKVGERTSVVEVLRERAVENSLNRQFSPPPPGSIPDFSAETFVTPPITIRPLVVSEPPLVETPALNNLVAKIGNSIDNKVSAAAVTNEATKSTPINYTPRVKKLMASSTASVDTKGQVPASDDTVNVVRESLAKSGMPAGFSDGFLYGLAGLVEKANLTFEQTERFRAALPRLVNEVLIQRAFSADLSDQNIAEFFVIQIDPKEIEQAVLAAVIRSLEKIETTSWKPNNTPAELLSLRDSSYAPRIRRLFSDENLQNKSRATAGAILLIKDDLSELKGWLPRGEGVERDLASFDDLKVVGPDNGGQTNRDGSQGGNPR